MKRGKLNILVDISSLVIFSLVVSTGVVLKAILPPGSGRLPGEGGTHDQILILWGLSRHQWGRIHTYLSIALLLVLSLHVALHWRFFSSAFGKKADPGLRRRIVLGTVGMLSVVALAAAPLLSPVKTLSLSTDTSRVLTTGRRIYELECGQCHGSEGRKIPRLPEGDEGVEFLRNARPEGVHGAIAHLSEADLDRLAVYLRSLDMNSEPP